MSHRNSSTYGYALGVFIMGEITNLDPSYFVLNPDVKAIHSKILLKHKEMCRKGTPKHYADGLALGDIAYGRSRHEHDDTTVAINACLRLIHMKNEELLTRTFGIDPKHFVNIKRMGVQEHTMDSVKVANTFLAELDRLFEEYEILKKRKKEAA